jgi:hypothetical protein
MLVGSGAWIRGVKCARNGGTEGNGGGGELAEHAAKSSTNDACRPIAPLDFLHPGSALEFQLFGVDFATFNPSFGLLENKPRTEPL